MTMSIAMMMNLLNGIMIIKTQGRESENKGRITANCVASRSCDGLVYVRRRKEAMEVTDSCF